MDCLWETPIKLFKKIDREFNFTLDVCATKESAKCSRYFTPADDGLSQEWSGVCWMNPPYGKEITLWLKKAWEHSHYVSQVYDERGRTNWGVVVALVPTRTNAPWWHDYVMKADEIRFIRKKISFVGSKVGVAFTGHALVVFRPNPASSPRVSSYDQY